MLQRRDQIVDDALGAGDMHGGRVGVVRRLAHIDVVVGMNRLLRAHHAAEHLDRAVRDHLIGVHVGLRAGAGLPDDQREMIVSLPSITSCAASTIVSPIFGSSRFKRHVCFGGGAFDDAERPHDSKRLLFPADLEISEGALRLRAPIAIVLDLDRAKSVGLGAGLRHDQLRIACCSSQRRSRSLHRLQARPGGSARQKSVHMPVDATAAQKSTGPTRPHGP